MSENKQRFDAIDGLRAFSAVGIVMMHILSNGNYGLNGFIFDSLIPSFTNLVFLFMIVSGFAMCCGYYEKIMQNKISFESFYKKRFAKILPFFAFLCILDFIMSPNLNSLYEVFANLTLCFGFLPNAGSISVIGVGWFLGLIFVFYLIFPFFCFLLANKKRAWFSLVIAFIFNVLCDIYFDVGRNNMVYSAVFFLCGGIIYLYRDKLVELSKKFRWPVLALCAVVAVMYYTLGDYVIVMIPLYASMLIYSLGRMGGILNNSLTKFLSGISLEIYLCHMVIFRVLEKIKFIHLFSNDMISYFITVIATLVGAIVFSKVAQIGINKISDIMSRMIANKTIVKGSKENV